MIHVVVQIVQFLQDVSTRDWESYKYFAEINFCGPTKVSKSCKTSFPGKLCTRFYKGLRNIFLSISGDEDTCQNYNFDTTELEDDSGRSLDNLFRIYFFLQARVIQLTCTTIFHLCSCTTCAEKVKVFILLSLGKIPFFCGYKVVIKIPFFGLWFMIYWCWYFLVLTYGISKYKFC